jgi:hypothetical protein
MKPEEWTDVFSPSNWMAERIKESYDTNDGLLLGLIFEVKWGLWLLAVGKIADP